MDGDAIDRNGKVPPEVVQGLKDIGAFGIKIPREYGGPRPLAAPLRAGDGDGLERVRRDGRAALGAPVDRRARPAQALRHPGAEAEVPAAPGARAPISAFALTEHDVGSDPAAHGDDAPSRTEDGDAYILNGEKLWCTNGTIAELLVVMARTPGKVVNGKARRQITAFIVETAWPGRRGGAALRLHGAQGHRERA